jgi:Tubulin binding cofactor A
MSKRVVAPVPSARRLQIQIGVCKRLVKEVAYYEAEVLTNEARVQKMRDDGKDSYGEIMSILVLQLS